MSKGLPQHFCGWAASYQRLQEPQSDADHRRHEPHRASDFRRRQSLLGAQWGTLDLPRRIQRLRLREAHTGRVWRSFPLRAGEVVVERGGPVMAVSPAGARLAASIRGNRHDPLLAHRDLAGSTGDSPVPSGDSPDGTAIKPEKDKAASLLRNAAAIPLGGSPSGNGRVARSTRAKQILHWTNRRGERRPEGRSWFHRK